MPELHDARHLGMAWFFVVFQVYVVWKVWRSRGQLAELKTLPSRTRYFSSVLINQAFLLLISLAVAYALGIPLYPRVLPTAPDLLLGLAACIGLVLLMVPRWKAAVKQGSRRLYFLMPQGAKEKSLWVAVSAAAGFGEETTYRGVLYLVLAGLTGQWWIAALLSALLFAGGHANQSRATVVILFGFGLVFQALAIRTGALYVPMLVHFLYDVVAGFAYAKLGREAGFRAEGVPDERSEFANP